MNRNYRRTNIIKKCKQCNKLFYPWRNNLNQIYCSRECSGKKIGYWKNKKHSEEHKKKISEACKGRKQYIMTDKIRKKMSDARKGIIPWNKGKKLSQETRKKMSNSALGKKISIKTREKMSLVNKGDKNPSWKGGITIENTKIRNSIEFRLWREAVFARDNWTCQKYRIKGGKLHSHHIQNFAKFPELRTSISNGITLSEKAHKEFHKIYGIKNNKQEQIKEFLNKLNATK